MKIPKNHPRRKSLEERARLERGFEKGVVAKAGLIAHGRGEAFDYLLGECTVPEAKKQVEAAAAMLVLAKRPVISVNGNTTALCAKEIVELAKAIPAEIEVNLFYRTKKRLRLIEKEFGKFGVKILGTRRTQKVPGLRSMRQHVDPRGIWAADVVLVMLEDGDRTEFLRRMGKKVIAVDLNPLSRTARKADVTIVDNVTRALPALAKNVKRMKVLGLRVAQETLNKYNNEDLLHKAWMRIRKGTG